MKMRSAERFLLLGSCKEIRLRQVEIKESLLVCVELKDVDRLIVNTVKSLVCGPMVALGVVACDHYLFNVD